jgi:1-deoxy-D-xylulose-5-phosphate reductoisomerase
MITVNSATLVNKGHELIEAAILFADYLQGDPYDAIDVVVHPQSLVHSMVTYVDGSTIAQISPPDMRLPIALALGWPERLAGAAPTMDWSIPTAMTFEPLDSVAFPAVELARAAGRAGGTSTAVFTAANEAAVAAFLAGHASFPSIVTVVEKVLAEHVPIATPTLEDVLHADNAARVRASELLAVVSA